MSLYEVASLSKVPSLSTAVLSAPVQQAFLLQQKLTDKRHPDHTLITYQNLGHFFYPSSKWQTSYRPIPEYVLADLYSWLEAHSGFIRTPTSMPSSSYSSSSNSAIHFSHLFHVE